MRLELGEFDEVSLGWPLVNELGEIEAVIPELWPDIDHEARARHIVHCVNNHERLVEALRLMLEEYEDVDLAEPEPEALTTAVRRGRVLLTALEAEKGGEL